MKIVILMFAILNSCTSNTMTFGDFFEPEQNESIELEPSKEFRGEIETSMESPNQKVGWRSCVGSKDQKPILLLESSSKFDSQEYCKSGVPQAFLASGINVFSIRMPKDFGGFASQETIRVFMDTLSKFSTAKVRGIWAYGEESIAAFNYAKVHPEPLNLIVGGGIFDFEDFANMPHTNSIALRINQLKANEDASFAERRSIAWNPDGLPKSVFVYHAEQDEFAPIGGARAFRDSLSSLGASVNIWILPEQKHVLSDVVHYNTLKEVLVKLKGQPN